MSLTVKTETVDGVEEVLYQAPEENCGCDCFSFTSCEADKEVVVTETIDDCIRLLTVNVKIDNVCPDKKLAVGVTLRDCKTKECITQKGIIIETGNCSECSSIERDVTFVLVGSLCGDQTEMFADVVSNYMCSSQSIEVVPAVEDIETADLV